MENKSKNYYLEEFYKLIDNVKNLDYKPRLLLHCCCGPCATYPVSILYKYFDLTLYYSNPNIYPIEEYDRRFETLKRFIEEYSAKHGFSYELIKENDDFETYQELFKPYKDDKEGGNRCLYCYKYRIEKGYKYASEHDFDYYTTVMTVSAKKPSSMLNEIGLELNKKYPNTTYLVSDFKKENGTLIGIQIAKEYKMYRQDYCGCIYSLNNRIAYLKRKEEELNGI